MDAELEARAEALFRAQPHNHTSGREPQWSIQPEHLKDVFRRMVSGDQARLAAEQG